jgi:eIF3a, PCI domain, TPR-like region
MVVQKPENVLRVCVPLLSDLVTNSCTARRRYAALLASPPQTLTWVELIAVGQNLAALQSLHEIITSKRSKSASLQSLEPIMLRFVELCVSLRKGKLAKEGMYQFKNIAQNTNVSSIEVCFPITCITCLHAIVDGFQAVY